jgi:hypothetical protein
MHLLIKVRKKHLFIRLTVYQLLSISNVLRSHQIKTFLFINMEKMIPGEQHKSIWIFNQENGIILGRIIQIEPKNVIIQLNNNNTVRWKKEQRVFSFMFFRCS